MQAAVHIQLEELKNKHPNKRVALITFATEVHVYGDASAAPLVIAGDKLNKEEELLAICERLDVTRLQPVEKSFENLTKVIEFTL